MEQTDLLRIAIESLQRLEVPYALVGSFASGAWGESRFTQDIDIAIDLNSSNVDSLCSAFPSPVFYVSRAAAREAVELRRQFNVIHPASGNKIDFMVVADTPWARTQFSRIRSVPLFAELEAKIAAPEDVILGKLLYYKEGGSEKHLRDIAGILKVSGDDVDRKYMTRFAKQLDVAELWESVRRSVEAD